MVQRDGNFECDVESKKRIMENLKKYYEDNSNYTFVYDINPDPLAQVDCTATAYTQSNEMVATYSIECKERDYTSTSFNEWWLEDDKYQEMAPDFNSKRCYYANLFTDGVLRMWYVNNLNTDYNKTVKLKKTTKGKTKQQQQDVWKKVYPLKNNQAKITI